jgi:DMSO/TMAO reductase YedYZ heme-binding membrane subunit
LAVAVLTPVAAALAALHYLWAVKTITAKETGYALVTAVLLGMWLVLRRRSAAAEAPQSPATK